jgi:hypothetical protein
MRNDVICINCNANFETEQEEHGQLCLTCLIEFQREKRLDKLNQEYTSEKAKTLFRPT